MARDFRVESSPQNRGTKASQAKKVRQKGTGPMMEKGSSSSTAENMPSSQGCRASLAIGRESTILRSIPCGMRLLHLSRRGKDTINSYADCYLFHAAV